MHDGGLGVCLTDHHFKPKAQKSTDKVHCPARNPLMP